MFILEQGARFVIPRTEMTYPAHSMKLHQNAADPEKSPVDHVMADFEDACPYEFKGEKSRRVMVEALNTLVSARSLRGPFGAAGDAKGEARLGRKGDGHKCNDCHTDGAIHERLLDLEGPDLR